MNTVRRSARAVGLAVCFLAGSQSVAFAVDLTCGSVVGIDRSGSYNFVKAGVELSGRLYAQAEPGCDLMLRWISGTSYANDEVFFHEVVRGAPLPDCSTNPFDVKCKQRQRQLAAQNAQVRRVAVEKIVVQNPARSNRTDIFGFLQAGSEFLAKFPDSARKRMYLGTDLDDNVHYKVTPNLKDVEVIVFALQNDPNPALMQQKRAEWESRFRKWGAKSVSFEPIEVIR